MEHASAKIGILRKITRWLFTLSDITAYLLSGFLLLVVVAYPFLLKNEYGEWNKALTTDTLILSAVSLVIAVLVAAITRRSIVVTLIVIILLATVLLYTSTYWPVIVLLIVIFLLPLIFSIIEYQHNKPAKE